MMRPAASAGRPSASSIALIASFPALSPLSIDIAQPALPMVAETFSASSMQIGLTLSLFMAGFGLAQLASGPLSDRIGRKRPLAFGCLLYGLAGIGCALAPDVPALIVLRAVQGLGAGACVVLAFAIVRDRYEGAAARLCLSYVNAAMWLAPVIAPSLGLVLLQVNGWRTIYAALGATGLILFAISMWGYQESLRTPDPALTVAKAWRRYRLIISHRAAFANALLVGLSFGGMFAYVTGASWTFLIYLHVSPTAFAAIFAAVAAGLSIGSIVSGRLAVSGGDGRRVTSAGVGGLFATSASLLGLVVCDSFTTMSSTPLLFLNAASMGLAMPGAVHGVLQPFPTMAGTASAVQGFLRMIGAAASSALVAILDDGSPLAMTLVMTAFSAAGVIVWAFAVPFKTEGAR